MGGVSMAIKTLGIENLESRLEVYLLLETGMSVTLTLVSMLLAIL